MKYVEHINRDQGNYIIASGIEFEDNLIKEPIIINGTAINVGEMTELYGWFTRNCRYAGYLKDGVIKQAFFFMGTGKAIGFPDGGYYYDKTYIIDKDRIGKIYVAGTFRDSCLRRKSNGKLAWS